MARLTKAQVLRKMADFIETRGHYQGRNTQTAGKDGVCLISTPAYRYKEYEGALAEFKKEIGLGQFGGIADWNDTHTTKVVVSSLRKTAKKLEKK